MKRHLIFGLLSMLASCAHTETAAPETTSNSLETAIQRDLARAGDQTKHVIRHNPVTCRCPSFELEVGARWVRVALTEIDVPESLAFVLNATATRDTAAKQLKNYLVYGSLLDTIQRCGQGAPYLTLALEAPPTPETEPTTDD